MCIRDRYSTDRSYLTCVPPVIQRPLLVTPSPLHTLRLVSRIGPCATARYYWSTARRSSFYLRRTRRRRSGRRSPTEITIGNGLRWRGGGRRSQRWTATRARELPSPARRRDCSARTSASIGTRSRRIRCCLLYTSDAADDL